MKKQTDFSVVIVLSLLLIDFFISIQSFANEWGSKPENLLQDCLIEESESFYSYKEKSNTKDEMIKLGDLAVAFSAVVPSNQSIHILSTEASCFNDYLKSLSEKYNIDSDFLFTTQVRGFASHPINKRTYYVITYQPSKQSPERYSWSTILGATVFTVPFTINQLKAGDQYLDLIQKAMQDLERQFLHEYYVKRDAVSVLGTGYLISLNQDLMIKIKPTDLRLSLQQFKLVNDPRVKYALLNFRANRFVELKMRGKNVPDNLQCTDIIKSFKIDPLKYQALIQTNMYVPYSYDRWWLLNSSRFPDFDQFVAQVNAAELDYTILDTDMGFCELLKTPLIQEGEFIPGGTNGPGCVGCSAGS